MIPFGSRFLLGAFAVSVLTLIIYMSVNWGALGTVGLLVISIAFALLAGINLYVRDSNVSVKDPTAATESPAARPAPAASVWPFIGGVGAVLLVVGLVTVPIVFIFGVVALVATVIEWMLGAWSERASVDRHFNSEVRSRLANPYEMPVLAALVAVIVIYSFSRIMLFLTKTGGPVAFGVVAALVLVIGTVVALRPSLRNGAVQAVAGVALLALVVGGVAAGLAGEREIDRHETLTDLAAHDECGAEETHADANASHTVGAQANILGVIRLAPDGTLAAQALGLPGWSQQLVVTRSNTTNVRFVNDSGNPARLVLEVGAAAATESESESEASVPDTVAEASDADGPTQYCTARIESGGTQFLTFRLGQATSEDHQVRFVVPGIEGQAVEVIIP